jgi:transcriptional regulator with XRE-family HTH domain
MVVAMNQPHEDLARLASYVVGARIKAGFATRKDFAAATGITARTLGKLETAAGRVSADTLARVTGVLGWTPDSPALVMAGREPVPAGGRPEPPSPPPRLSVAPSLPPAGRLGEWLTSLPDEDIVRVVAHDPLLRQVWNLEDGTGKPADRAQRIAMLVVVLTPVDPLAAGVAERHEGSAGLGRAEIPHMKEIVKIRSPSVVLVNKSLTSEMPPVAGRTARKPRRAHSQEE